MLLLRALSGSRLYGTARPDSDWDWYEVHDHVRARQRKVGDLDVIKMPLSQWLRLCEKGTHQALDAMWCPPHLTTTDLLTEFRAAYRVDPFRVADQLERTAYSMRNNKAKHVDRLLHCAMRVREQGWYDPSEVWEVATWSTTKR